MTLVELLIFMAVLLVGGSIGAGAAWLLDLIFRSSSSNFIAGGAFTGAATGFIGIFVYGWWFGKMDKIHPPCRCGTSDWDDFESSSIPGFANVTKCRCGRQYVKPKWGLWYEFTDSRSAVLFNARWTIRISVLNAEHGQLRAGWLGISSQSGSNTHSFCYPFTRCLLEYSDIRC